MNTPKEIPLTSLHHATWNPRGTDLGDLADITASVKEEGIRTALVARPHDEGFEVLCGHRRLAAAAAAGLETVPVVVKDLDDKAALELAIVDNMHRKDVHPFAEAEAFRLLHEDHAMTVEQIAARCGKSKAYVYGRLKLCALSAKARKAALEAGLGAEVALLIARIPSKELQEKAVKEIATGGYEEEQNAKGHFTSIAVPMSFREAARHVRDHFMLRLADAPFDIKDAELVKKAGACGDCPKRTGNNPDLFGDVANADVCTDPPCFEAKRAAGFAAKTKAATEAGAKILPKKQAEKIFATYGGDEIDWQAKERYAKLGSKIPGDAKGRTYKQALGEDAKPLLAEAPSGAAVELVDLKAAAPALKKAGVKAQASRSSSGGTYNYAAQEKKQREDKKIQDAVLAKIDEVIRAKVKKEKPIAILRLAARGLERLAYWAAKRHLGDKDHDKKIAKLGEDDLRAFIGAALYETLEQDGDEEIFEKEMGFDREKVEAELAAKTEKPAKPKKKAA